MDSAMLNSTYTLCPEKRGHSILGITLTNLHSFVIFGVNHPDTSFNVLKC